MRTDARAQALVGLVRHNGVLTQSAQHALVELVRDYRVLDEDLKGDDGEGGLVGGFKDDGAGCSGLLDFEPAGGADAPAIAGAESGESVMRHRGGQVVA